MITTGKQSKEQGTPTPLDEASSRLQSKGAAVFVLGIGDDVDSSELNQIASGPKNVFRVDSFADLDEKSNDYKRGICILGIVWERGVFSFFYLVFILYVERYPWRVNGPRRISKDLYPSKAMDS